MTTLPTPEGTRRPGVPAEPIALADGRAWGFARPSPRFKPDFGGGCDAGSIAVRTVVEYPLEVQRLRDALTTALGGGSDADRYEALFDLAAVLLRRGHEIDPGTAARLLAVGVEDLPRFAGELIAVAFGGRPTASATPPKGADHD